MAIQTQGSIKRSWGIELSWASNESYSGKILVFEKENMETPLMFHKERKKTWFINSGKFKITVCDVKTGRYKEVILEEGQTAEIGECSPHRAVSMVPNSMIFEVGSKDDTDDIFLLSTTGEESSEEQRLDLQSSHHREME
jgi:mannose-6-phosphate isomerase-like protein (cupin superfamily)